MVEHVTTKYRKSIKRNIIRSAFGVIALAIAASLLSTMAACEAEDAEPKATAYRVTSRAQLIGGPTALGEIGDWMIENDQVRVLIQDIGFNRGSGIFGGSLIDADLVRHDAHGSPLGGSGRDTFGELFPAFFLEVMDPEEIVVVNDGSNGEAAVVEVRGKGGEFVTMLRFFNQAMINSYDARLGDLINGHPANSDGEPMVRFVARYTLEPGARHVVVENTVYNDSPNRLDFPNSQIATALQAFLQGVDLSQFYVPTGSVLGFGALNRIFLPGIGYDVRFGLEEAYQREVDLPAFPGHLTDLVGSSSNHGINYGFATAADPENNFAYFHNERYGGVAKPDDMLFLFYASGFGGVFTSQLPRRLAPSFCTAEQSAEDRCAELHPDCGDDEDCTRRYNRCVTNYPGCLSAQEQYPSSFTFTNYFLIGTGDVASLRDELYKVKEVDTHSVQVRVVDESTLSAVEPGVTLLVYQGVEGATNSRRACQATATGDKRPRLYSQAFTKSHGMAEFQLPAGQYCLQTRGTGRPLSDLIPLEVTNKNIVRTIEAKSAGVIEAFIVDASGQPLPAKITVVGSYTNPENTPTREFLFDLRAGEHWRTSERVEYAQGNPMPRRYIEETAFSGADGKVSVTVKPGKYTVYFSRGLEYDLDTREVEVLPGQRVHLNGAVERVVRPDGYLSGDFHLHAQGSIDSGLDYNQRVLSVAAEGVEVPVSSDHNYISDFMPYIYSNNLDQWMKSVIGLELTTFEAGHFNVFPLKYDVSSMNRGSVPWQDIPPQEVFDSLREMGSLGPANTIIQVNHPRDSILGYFSQHNVSPFDTSVDLKFNTTPEGTDRLFALLATPSGPAFIDTYEERGVTRYRSTFSWDFDAIEIVNGKRIELIRHYRMPYNKDELPEHIREQLSESEIAALPPKGTVLCDGDELVSAGVLDDWYNFLNHYLPDGTYKPFTATGNSDSHAAGSPGDPEPGYPRNYFYVGHNDVTQMTDNDLATAIKEHHNIVTNGPFINMVINQAVIGQTVTTSSSEVTITLSAMAADWVGADYYRLVANGEVVDEGVIVLLDGRWEKTLTLEISQDTWFVLEGGSNNNLFPVVAPSEIPPVAFDDAIGSLAGPFGFGQPSIRGLEPSLTFEVRPFAFTNPIWVVYDAENSGRDSFIPPSPPVATCIDGKYAPDRTSMLDLRSHDSFDHTPPIDTQRRLDTAQIPGHHHHHHEHDDFRKLFRRTTGEVRDLRVLFDAWGHCH